jgi:hypothetical protein
VAVPKTKPTLATRRILFMADILEQPLTSSSVSTGSRSSVDTASCASPVAPRRLSRNSCSSSRGLLPAAQRHIYRCQGRSNDGRTQLEFCVYICTRLGNPDAVPCSIVTDT